MAPSVGYMAPLLTRLTDVSVGTAPRYSTVVTSAMECWSELSRILAHGDE